MHRRHAIRITRIPLLNRVHGFAGLGEDVGIFWGREDPVEGCFVKAFAGGEDFAGGVGGAEGEFVGGDADDGAVEFVEEDVVGFGVAVVGGPDWGGVNRGKVRGGWGEAYLSMLGCRRRGRGRGTCGGGRSICSRGSGVRGRRG